MTFNRSRVLMFMVLLVGTLAAVGNGTPASAAPGAPAAPQGVGDASCSAPAPHGFDDVPTTYFANTAIAWLVEAGITTGTTPTTFSPNNQVTRAEMAVFLWRNTCPLPGPNLGIVTTLAGNGTRGFADDPGANAQFAYPAGVAVAPNGTVYVTDDDNNRIRAVNPATGAVTTLAGSGTAGFADGPSNTAC